MLSLFLPGINALIPQYVLMRDLHLTNSLTGIIMLDSLGESVFISCCSGGFMQSLPKELEESATMDGASMFQFRQDNRAAIDCRDRHGGDIQVLGPV